MLAGKLSSTQQERLELSFASARLVTERVPEAPFPPHVGLRDLSGVQNRRPVSACRMEYPRARQGPWPATSFHVHVQCVAKPAILPQGQLQPTPLSSAVDSGCVECRLSSFWGHFLSSPADIQHDTDSCWEMLPSRKSRSSTRRWKCILASAVVIIVASKPWSLKTSAAGTEGGTANF